MAVRERPNGLKPVMSQKWRDLLFLHWEWDPAEIQATLPPGLTVDLFGGKTFLGVVPFFMQGIRPWWSPPVPGISSFLEMNLRTYVVDESGMPGVWFYSLDANQKLAVRIARKFFHLPYFDAKMSARKDAAGRIVYSCQRHGVQSFESDRFSYGAGGYLGTAAPGTLEFFLLERYVLFAWDGKKERLFSGQVYHKPYSIYEAALGEWSNHVLQWDHFPQVSRDPDHVAFSPGVDVEVYAVQQAGLK